MDEETVKPKIKSKQIFINHLDTYHSNNIGKFLSKCVTGASTQEEEEEEVENPNALIAKEGLFEIIGTVLNEDCSSGKLGFAKRIIKFETRDELFKSLSETDVIIYNILDDEYQLEEASWLLKKFYDEIDTLSNQKQIILLSTIMTWAKTKQLDPEEEMQIPFTEEDFRRRLPHPNFRRHIDLEKTIIKYGNANKEKMITYVVASGMTYGCGENVFHSLFKEAWENSQFLEVIGSGQNFIPTIHVHDLAGVLQNLIDGHPKTRYLLATDDSKNTLEEITKTISKGLSNGKIKYVTKEEVLTNEDMKQNEYDQMLINLQIDPVFVKESQRIKWVSETGLVENINKILKEFKTSRNLIPFRVCILGPPSVGKSTIAEQIAANYRIHWVQLKELIEETVTRLERNAAKVDAEIVEGEEEEAEKAADDAELLESINESKAENNGRIELKYITKFLKSKLLSKPLKNQGFILDNYPKTKEQAEDLFNVGEDDEDEAEEEEDQTPDEEKPSFNKNLLPNHVIVLEAEDEFLKKRIMELPEPLVTGTHNTEEGFIRRLTEYRAVNNEEDTVLNYFEDKGVSIIRLDVMKDEFQTAERVIKEMSMILGASRNYHPTPAQLAKEKRKKEEELESKNSLMTEERKRQKQEEERLREERREAWSKKLESLKKEEDAFLEEKSQPLRNYLLRHVMPVLTEGLIDCVKNRPENAIDHLAEFLFRNNPQYD